MTSHLCENRKKLIKIQLQVQKYGKIQENSKITQKSSVISQLGLRPCRNVSTGPQKEAVWQRATFNPFQFY